MSQAGRYLISSGPTPSPVLTLTGNTGGPVGPDGAGNIDVVGSGAIDVAGNAGTNTLTISVSGVAETFDADVGSATPAAGVITIAGGTGINTSAAVSTVTINLDVPVSIANGGTNAITFATTDGTVYFDGTRLVTTATGTSGQVLTSNGVGVAPTYQDTSAYSFPWIEVVAGAQAMAVNTGYIANFGTPITFTLPLVAAQGTIFRICGKGAGGYLIAQNGGQTIFFGVASTTTGATGTLTAADPGNTIELLCITANTDFRVLSSVGNFTPA